MNKKKKPNAQQLYAAIRKHNIESLRKLLGEGADPNACVHDDYHGDIPVLLCAAGILFAEGVESLLKAGANPNAAMTGGKGARGGATALHNAISGGDTRPGSDTKRSTESDRQRIVDMLLKAGADLHAIDAGERIPLQCASRSGRLEICKQLIKAGASVKDWPDGCTPPLIGAAFGVPPHSVPEGEEYEDVARLLLEHGAPVDGENIRGVTALMAAAKQGSHRLVDVFLENGANVNHQAKDGSTPLLFAAEYARWAMADDEHQLALKITKRLIDAGANLDVKSAEGESAYDIASSNRGSGQLTAEYLKKLTSSRKTK